MRRRPDADEQQTALEAANDDGATTQLHSYSQGLDRATARRRCCLLLLLVLIGLVVCAARRLVVVYFVVRRRRAVLRIVRLAAAAKRRGEGDRRRGVDGEKRGGDGGVRAQYRDGLRGRRGVREELAVVRGQQQRRQLRRRVRAEKSVEPLGEQQRRGLREDGHSWCIFEVGRRLRQVCALGIRGGRWSRGKELVGRGSVAVIARDELMRMLEIFVRWTAAMGGA